VVVLAPTKLLVGMVDGALVQQRCQHPINHPHQRHQRMVADPQAQGSPTPPQTHTSDIVQGLHCPPPLV